MRISALTPFDRLSPAGTDSVAGVTLPRGRSPGLAPGRIVPGLRDVLDRIAQTISKHPTIALTAAYWLTVGTVDFINDWLLLGLSRPIRPWMDVAREVALWWGTWLPLTPLIVRAARHWPFDRSKIARSIGRQLMISILAATAHLLIASVTFQFLFPAGNSVAARMALWTGGFTLTEFLVCWGLMAIVGTTGSGSPSETTPAAGEERAATFFTVREKARIRLVPVDSVDWLEAVGNYVRLHVGESQHLVRGSLKTTVERLHPHRFVQIHRSTVVNVDRIRQIEPWFSGDYMVTLENGRQLKVSRTYRGALLEPMI